MSQDDFVHIIDDDADVRDSLAALLAAAGHAVRTYPSALRFMDSLPEAPGGCVITDVQMPEMTGLELLKRLDGQQSRFNVIVLTGRANVPMAVEALKDGASDFIEKPFEPDAIVSAVEAALARLAREQARSGRHADYAQRLATLSARECDVLDGLVAGSSNKEIAKALQISPRTVESYRANIMMKTQASSLSELVRMMLLSEAEP